MSTPRGYSSNRDLSEAFHDFLAACARFVFGIGTAATIIAAALLIFNASQLAGGADAATLATAAANVEMFRKVLLVGVLGMAIGSTYLFWGEEILGAIQLILAGIMYFVPLLLAETIAGASPTPPAHNALLALQHGGIALGVIGFVVLVVDVANRTRERIQNGTRADQLKYGKGVKEESDRQNVFLGKCWQLPFCRKFVREKCPIYHSRRTCWKEKVGCMCEEEVIRQAMANRTIPKDQLLAANMIPRNARLTFDQKKERCRSCVIYNEHQRHKYRAILPLVVLFFAGFYLLFRLPLLTGTQRVVGRLDELIHVGTLGATGGHQTPGVFVEMLLIVLVIVMLSYAMKVLEFMIFRLKI
jgi:hypothetical protein